MAADTAPTKPGLAHAGRVEQHLQRGQPAVDPGLLGEFCRLGVAIGDLVVRVHRDGEGERLARHALHRERVAALRCPRRGVRGRRWPGLRPGVGHRFRVVLKDDHVWGGVRQGRRRELDQRPLQNHAAHPAASPSGAPETRSRASTRPISSMMRRARRSGSPCSAPLAWTSTCREATPARPAGRSRPGVSPSATRRASKLRRVLVQAGRAQRQPIDVDASGRPRVAALGLASGAPVGGLTGAPAGRAARRRPASPARAGRQRARDARRSSRPRCAPGTPRPRLPT